MRGMRKLSAFINTCVQENVKYLSGKPNCLLQ